MSIFELPRLAGGLPCRENTLWRRIYESDVLHGGLELVPGLRYWVEERFGNRTEVENQKIIRTANLITGEGALFNSLRSKRPADCFREKDLDSLVEEHRKNCPFCSPEDHTPEDLFGRIRGEYCLTASNLAKYDAYHGLIISREHHPLGFNEDMAEDYFRVAARWFQAVETGVAPESGPALYPFLIWNCLWPAGSSILHGHLQLTVAQKRPYPKVEQLLDCSLRYAQHYRSDYFQDFYTLYRALGLGWEDGEVRFLSILTPIKEKEIWILLPPGPVTLDRLGQAGRAAGRVLDRLKQQTCLQSFNAAVYLPPLKEGGEDSRRRWENYPLLVRLVDRGEIFNRTADFGAMELFALSVISSDPFAVARLIRP